MRLRLPNLPNTAVRYSRTVLAEMYSHSGTVRNSPARAYDVDATATLYEQHGWDIHAL